MARFRGQADAATPSAEMYRVYRRWCSENGLDAVRSRAFYHWLADNGMKYGVKANEHIKKGDLRCRGYIGLCIKDEWRNVSAIMGIY